MLKIISALLDIIYPPRCVYCYNILGADLKWTCSECEREAAFVNEPACPKCGLPVENENKACTGCREREFHFIRNHALFIYEGTIREAIHRYKYKSKPRYSIYFGRLISEKFKEQLAKADIITGVPLHKNKLKARGYNQAELLAAEISVGTGLIHMPGLLKRVRKTKAQSVLAGFKARENNVKDAFAISDNINIKGKKIILVDDIFTTGSTLNECSKILLRSGAESIETITLSITAKKKDS